MMSKGLRKILNVLDCAFLAVVWTSVFRGRIFCGLYPLAASVVGVGRPVRAREL